MAKIVSAINVMIAHPENIGQVLPGRANSEELFFVYKGRYKWSIMRIRSGDDYQLFYYPLDVSIENLASMDEDDWRDFPHMIVYKSSEIEGRETQQSFGELYSLIAERAYGMNDVLDDIIGDDVDF